ncbi:MAG: DNA-protecting protein DprA [Gemmatimonadetes bacterium]|nr:DNA-protecting protein DprA [Gemmatimonadota bacterium]
MAFNIQVLVPSDAAWPWSLRDLAKPPTRLHLVGNAELLAAPTGLVAIVGTRDSTTYGERVADSLGYAFAAAGVPVISGMARGIDAAAHRGALRAGGRTIAVLGTGVDVPYPAGHRALHAEIAARGLLIAEQEPGARAHAGSFPLRNRLIAALARLVIVVEAPHKSGAMNTVEQALGLGRGVAAVPGPIDSPQSAGANWLLGSGGQVVATIEDALALMGVHASAVPPTEELDPGEAEVLAGIPSSGAYLDEVAMNTGLPVRQAGVVLTSLELKGRIWLGSDGRVSRRL